MSGFEWNKIAGAVLLAGLIAMVVGTVADALYHPDLTPKKRGFEVAVETSAAPGETAKKEEPVNIPVLLASADPEAGEKFTKKCTTCHSLDKGGPNKIGPDLWDVVGRKKAVHEGFPYSDAMKGKGGEWDYEALFAFLKLPKAYVPGTKMTFAGISKPQDIANVVAYLRTRSDAPKALPEPVAAATPAESAAEPAKEKEKTAPAAEAEKPQPAEAEKATPKE